MSKCRYCKHDKPNELDEFASFSPLPRYYVCKDTHDCRERMKVLVERLKREKRKYKKKVIALESKQLRSQPLPDALMEIGQPPPFYVPEQE